MNELIWFLTDTDFSKEWNKSSFLGKINLCYTTFGFLLCWVYYLIMCINVIAHF